MEFRILGPLEVEENGRLLAPSGSKARALLALLILHANEPVSIHRLVDEIWGDELPANDVKTLQIHVSRLRRSLGPERLTTAAGGYALTVADGELDRDRAVSLVEAGERLLDEAHGEDATKAFEEALSLFRGRPLEEFAHDDFARTEIARLEDVRLRAEEGRVEADLRLGRGARAVGLVDALLAEHPLRERLHEQRMRALYQAGRQADALEAYQDARRTFVELGLEPGPGLQELERRILNHDPSLLGRAHRARPRPPSVRTSVGRRRALYVGAAAILVGLLLVAVAAWTYSRTDATVPPRSLAMLDPETLAFGPTFDLDGTPGDVEVGRRAVFVSVPARGSIVAVDPRTRTAVSLGAPVQRPTRLTAGAGGLWVLDGHARRIALLGSTQVRAITAARGRGDPAPLDAVVATDDALWLAERNAEIMFRLDVATGRSRAIENRGADSFFEGDARRAVAVAAGSVWASNPVSIFPASDRLGRVSRLDATSGELLATIRVPSPPVALASDSSAVWVALERGEQLWRIDPHDNVAVAAVRVPGGVVDVAIGQGRVWALSDDGRVTRIDPRTNAITGRVDVGREGSIAVGHGAVWIATR